MIQRTEKSLEYIGLLVKLSSLCFGLCFIIGFLIWNIYSTKLGYAEYQIIQTKFVLAGFTFLFILAVILIIFKKIVLFFLDKIKKTPFSFTTILVIFIFIFSVYSYSILIFPLIPQEIGGGRPFFISLIGSKENIEELSKHGVELGKGSDTQTAHLCIVSESNGKFLFLEKDRILRLDTKLFNGFGFVPGEDRKIGNRYCSTMSLYYLSIESCSIVKKINDWIANLYIYLFIDCHFLVFK